MAPRIVYQQEKFRAVETVKGIPPTSYYVIEERRGQDSMGIYQWEILCEFPVEARTGPECHLENVPRDILRGLLRAEG